MENDEKLQWAEGRKYYNYKIGVIQSDSDDKEW